MNISHRLLHTATNVGLPQGARWRYTRAQIPVPGSLSMYAVAQGHKGEKVLTINRLGRIFKISLGRTRLLRSEPPCSSLCSLPSSCLRSHKRSHNMKGAPTEFRNLILPVSSYFASASRSEHKAERSSCVAPPEKVDHKGSAGSSRHHAGRRSTGRSEVCRASSVTPGLSRKSASVQRSAAISADPGPVVFMPLPRRHRVPGAFAH